MYNRVLFIGSKAAGYRVLNKIYTLAPNNLVGCVTVNDNEDSRSDLGQIKNYCYEKHIELDVLSGNCDLTRSIERFKPDICIVMGWYYIIKSELLESIQGGFIGIHYSLLPQHRGFAPVVWSIIDGDDTTGFSVFSLNCDMDSGMLWYQERIDIKKEEYISDVIEKLEEKVLDFFDRHFLDLLQGNMKPYKQTGVVSYGAKRTPSDGRIDWNQEASKIYNFIRAQSRPYPGAYSYYQGRKIIIWSSTVFAYSIQGFPGQIGLINNKEGYIVIVCGDNTGLVVNEIEEDGVLKKATVIKSLTERLL